MTLSTPKARLVFFIGLAVLIALGGLVFIRSLVDFRVYYAAGQSLFRGRTDLYAPDFGLGPVMDYRYPPFFLVFFWPLWLLPYNVTAYLWYLCSVAEIIGCIFFVRRVVVTPTQNKSLWLTLFFIVAPYFINILHYGNAHLLAIFLMFAACYFAFKEQQVFSGLALALAISIKLVPAFLLPYFLIRKQWPLLASVAVFLIVINLAPAGFFGFAGNNDLLKKWEDHVIVSQEFHEANGPINLSLKGQLRRYFSPVDYSQRGEGDTQYPEINLASAPQSQIDFVWKAIAVLISLAAFCLITFSRYMKRKNQMGESDTGAQTDKPGTGAEKVGVNLEDSGIVYSREIGLLICVMLLIGPLTSKIYFIALLWPVASLAVFAFNQTTRPAPLIRRLLISLAVINSVLPLLPGHSLQRWLLVLGVDFYVNLLLLLALAYVMFRATRSVQARFGEPQRSIPSAARTS